MNIVVQTPSVTWPLKPRRAAWAIVLVVTGVAMFTGWLDALRQRRAG